MKKILLVNLFILISNIIMQAQGVGINDDNSTPDASAMLDVKSTTKGILIPRMTSTERTAISTPATGLMVFDNTTLSFWYYDGTQWTEIGASTSESPFDTLGGVVIPNVALVNETADDFVFGSTQLDDDGIQNHDKRFFFDKSLAAFRAGDVSGTEWDEANIGEWSTAFGEENIASGDWSMVWGNNNESSGLFSTTFGLSNVVSGIFATAWGSSNTVSGSTATAWGNFNTVSFQYATAWGQGNTVSGFAATAWGQTNTASGNYATVWGTQNITSNTYTTAFGNSNIAAGYGTLVGGLGLDAASYYETIFGAYNTTYTPNDSNAWDTSDRLFVLGNGTGDATRSNALTIYKDGKMNINDAYDMPTTDGTAGQVMTTDGAGVVSWASASNEAPFDTLGGVVIPNSNMVDAATNDFVFGATQLDDDGTTNDDSRLFFDKSKGSFRAGYVTGTEWDEANIGNYSAAFGQNNIALGNNSVAFGQDNTISGGRSAVFGQNNTVSSNRSVAFGQNNTVSGSHAAAFGDENAALGSHAVVWGEADTASGTYTTAWGQGNTASSYGETALGLYSTTYTASSGTAWNSNDRLFTIGNGTGDAARSNALTIYKNGTMNINDAYDMPTADGTSGQVMTTDGSGVVSWSSISVETPFDTLGGVVIPNANLVDDTADDFVFGGTQLDDDGTTDDDSRFFFDKSKAAFRAGKVGSTQWDESNVGTNSVAFGQNNTASGNQSTAFGQNNSASSGNTTAWGQGNTASSSRATAWGNNTTASSINTTAWGLDNIASGSESTAWGDDNTASGSTSTAFGQENTASGNWSTTWGQSNTTSGNYSTAWGAGNTSSELLATSWGSLNTCSGQYATSWGLGNDATGDYSTVWGRNSEATGDYATAIGYNVEAPSYGEVVVGIYNTSYTPNSATSRNGNDRVFVVGNGSSTSNRSDAMVILKNGRVGIGTNSPSYELQVGTSGDGTTARANAWNTFSDRRWKKDFEIIPNALGKLNQINGYFYNWKDQSKDSSLQVGVIAQEIEAVLPECVSTDDNGYKSVDYSKLTALLIQVNKEQEAKIMEQAVIIQKLENQQAAANTRLQRIENILEQVNTTNNWVKSK